MDQAEKLRKLVKEQNSPKPTSRVITVTSGKGGVGKSSISVNLALALSRLGKKVLILDADFGLANIEVMLGIRPKYNLADLMFKGKNLPDIITNGPENIGFISGGSGIQELTNLTKDQIIYLINKLVELDQTVDIIIIDTGAGITDSVLQFATASSEILLVTTPEPTSITDAYALLKTLNKKANFSVEDTAIRLIANRVTLDEKADDIYEKLKTVASKFLNLNLDYLGYIPLDNTVSKAVIRQQPVISVYPNSSFAKQINSFAMKLCDTDMEINQRKKGITQVFLKLLRSRIQK
ncbi:MinD/ParA family protein [Herbinix luporum]|jgi:flagellar biosynthesis protein FlhG|uniref:MinD/ParA family protein n=1 Tax=Herbinix luporum TaxID=1679721 RepID=UPI0017734509|nr:MinD/ParA family protein [Herbinix luporum]HHT57012.1 MinD/ParA family protein [Herbinix luporum]